jgi:hypothetical protein
LNELWAPYRFYSEAIVRLLDLVTPGIAGLQIAADVVLPVAAAAVAWALAAQLFASAGARTLCAFLLLFGQELFSLANSIVWPGGPITQLRQIDPPVTTQLIPDAATSYFGLFRTPEPAASWILLLGFLALVSSRDPLSAFEGRRRYITFPIFGLLGFAYPFSSVPIVLITLVVCFWALSHEKPRTRGVLIALVLAIVSYTLATVAAWVGDGSGTLFFFESRYATVSPALLIGATVVGGFILVHRWDVFRRLDFLIPCCCALLPILISNQQIVTGLMVSTRDWERYTNYILVVFAAASLLASLEIPYRMTGSRSWTLVQSATWITAGLLGTQLLLWQKDVYDIWASTNAEANQIVQLLDGLDRPAAEYPVVLEDAALVPLVRLLTNDRFTFVLDYTRLFQNPVPTFADSRPETSDTNASDLFDQAYRLGWTPSRLEQQIRAELVGLSGGFYSHFLFSLADVWPPLTDNRRLRLDTALHRLPSIVAAYARFLDRRQAETTSGSAVVIARRMPAKFGQDRVNQLIATAPGTSEDTMPLRVYVQRREP